MNLKQFAQQARNILLNGVTQKLHYWGFETNNTITNQPQAIPGGYTFRGNIYDNPNVVALWNELKKAIAQNGFETVAEEAAYTWFNRIIALHILAKNNYEQNLLDNAQGMFHTPIILQKARQGHYPYLNKNEQDKLLLVLNDYSKDEEIFSQLFIAYCRKHPLIQNIFGQPNDYTELLLPNNMLLDTGFLHLINTAQIPDQQYQQAELIGWLYQFYISEKKDQVFANFKKGKKAEAKDIPAATQIFTPNWIVKYLTQNTIGKLWLDMHPNSPLKQQLNYYINTQQQNQPIVTQVAEIKVLDPACGSGHILVEAFDLLYQMYMLEYYPPDEAIESILQNNLFGLDLDKRATQLASFAILLKAAKYYPQILTKGIYPHIYPMPEPKSFNAHDITLFLQPNNLQYHPILQQTLHLCQNAHNIGSVLKLNANPKAHQCFKQQLQHLQNKPNKDIEEQALLNNLQPYLNVILLLTQKYEAVVANPPYMGQSTMNNTLKNYINEHYPISKSDLMTVFMEVIPNLTVDAAYFAIINLPSWLFLSSFETLRKKYIENYQFQSLLHMGRGIFGIDFGSVAFVIKKENNTAAKGTYFRLHERNFQHIYYEDIAKLFLYSNGKTHYRYNFNEYRGEEGVTEIPENGTETGQQIYYPNVPQSNFSKITGSPIAYWVSDKVIEKFSNPILETVGATKVGIQTGDNDRFLRLWHEVNMPNIKFNIASYEQSKQYPIAWVPYSKGGEARRWYGNNDLVVNWNDGGDYLKNFTDAKGNKIATLRNRETYFKPAITWSLTSSNAFAARLRPSGFVYDINGMSAFPIKDENTHYLIALLNTKISFEFLKVLNPTMAFQKGDISRIPTILAPNEQIDELAQSCISIAKQDWDSREVSWDFEQMPLLSYTGNNIAQSYAAWHQAVSHSFFALHTHEETLNRLFIAIYGLQAELTPTIALSDISILQDELDTKALEKQEAAYRLQPQPSPLLPIKAAVVVQQFVLYGIGIAMGRYRLGKPGLHIAHQNPTAAQLQPYHYGQHTLNPDPDGIIPLMGTNGAFPDDALHQIHGLLDAIWGDDSRTQNLNFIQAALDKDLEKYLVKDFWKNHCSIYKKKPIYWLFSSSKGAFQVLVYMHRINAFTLEKIRANYLFPHLKNLAAQINRLEANSTLQGKDLDRLRKDLDECQQYDLLLKPKADAQINLNLDQGVSANYAHFEGVVAKIV